MAKLLQKTILSYNIFVNLIIYILTNIFHHRSPLTYFTYCTNECQIKQKAQIVEQTSVPQNFVRSQKVEQTDCQEHSHTRTSIFAKSASNFQLREICSTFLVDRFL